MSSDPKHIRNSHHLGGRHWRRGETGDLGKKKKAPMGPEGLVRWKKRGGTYLREKKKRRFSEQGVSRKRTHFTNEKKKKDVIHGRKVLLFVNRRVLMKKGRSSDLRGGKRRWHFLKHSGGKGKQQPPRGPSWQTRKKGEGVTDLNLMERKKGKRGKTKNELTKGFP